MTGRPRRNVARDIGAMTAVLGLAAVAFLISTVGVFVVLPRVAPVQGKDFGYPFAALAISIIVGFGAAVLSLKVAMRFMGRKPN